MLFCRTETDAHGALLSRLCEVFERGEELIASVCWLNHETGSWEVETELPAQRSHHCLAVLGGFIFAAGGSSTRDNGGDAASNVLYRYDPRHNLWTWVECPSSCLMMSLPVCCLLSDRAMFFQGAPMNQRRVDFHLGAVGDRLIAVGGRNDTGALSSVEVYSPTEDCWSYVAGLPRYAADRTPLCDLTKAGTEQANRRCPGSHPGFFLLQVHLRTCRDGSLWRCLHLGGS